MHVRFSFDVIILKFWIMQLNKILKNSKNSKPIPTAVLKLTCQADSSRCNVFPQCKRRFAVPLYFASLLSMALSPTGNAKCMVQAAAIPFRASLWNIPLCYGALFFVPHFSSALKPSVLKHAVPRSLVRWPPLSPEKVFSIIGGGLLGSAALPRMRGTSRTCDSIRELWGFQIN